MDNQRDSSQFLDDLAQFLYEETEGLPLEDNIAELRESGIDVVGLRSEIEQLLRKKQGQMRLAKANKQREIDLGKIRTSRDRGNWTTNIRDKIKSLLGDMPLETASVYYRKFEEAKDEDLESLLEDLENLNLLEDE